MIMRTKKSKTMMPKIVACLLAGAIIGGSGFSYARTHYYYYNNGNGGMFKTTTWYPDDLAAYLGIVGGPIPVHDKERFEKATEELKKAKELVSAMKSISQNTNQLWKLMTGKSQGLNSGVLDAVSNELDRASTISENSLFHISKTVDGSDLILNTRLTYAAIADPEKVQKYEDDLIKENIQIVMQGQQELQRLNSELQKIKQAIDDVSKETHKKTISDAELKKEIDALSEKEKTETKELNLLSKQRDEEITAMATTTTKVLEKYGDADEGIDINKNKLSEFNQNLEWYESQLRYYDEYDYDEGGSWHYDYYKRLVDETKNNIAATEKEIASLEKVKTDVANWKQEVNKASLKTFENKMGELLQTQLDLQMKQENKDESTIKEHQ